MRGVNDESAHAEYNVRCVRACLGRRVRMHTE